jgi:prepilin-type N-terminal cleavage/methylation domain-containing protein
MFSKIYPKISIKSGFTLLELLVVIAIIGLLSAVVVASLNSSRTKANIAAGKQLDSTLGRSLGDQLLGTWFFDDCSGAAAKDSSGNNWTSTIIGSTIWDVDTPYNRGCSIRFSSGSYVQIDTNVGSTFSVQPNTARTFSAWFKSIGTTGTNQTIIWKNGGCVGWDVVLRNTGNVFGTFTTPGCGGSQSYSVTSTGTYNDGNWHQVAISVDRINGVLTLYIDGKSIGSTGLDTTSTGSGGSFLVGNDWDFTQYFDGNIDEVRAYGSVLSLAQINRLYQEGVSTHFLAKN